MPKGKRPAHPSIKTYRAAMTLDEASWTAMLGAYNRPPLLAAFMVNWCGDVTVLGKGTVQGLVDALIDGVERGDAALFEDLANLLRLARDGRIGGLLGMEAADPDMAAVLGSIMGERLARKDPNWTPSAKEVCEMLPDPTGSGRNIRQAQRIQEKLKHILSDT